MSSFHKGGLLCNVELCRHCMLVDHIAGCPQLALYTIHLLRGLLPVWLCH